MEESTFGGAYLQLEQSLKKLDTESPTGKIFDHRDIPNKKGNNKNLQYNYYNIEL